MTNLSEFERTQILIYIGYGDKKRSFTEILIIFNENNPNRDPISKSTIFRTYNRYLFNFLTNISNYSIIKSI